MADGTDLLSFFVWKHKVATQISMKKHDGSIININATAEKLGDKCKCLLPLHSLTRCHSVSYPFGKGKTKAVNLFLHCDRDASEQDVLKAGSDFLVRLCGSSIQATDLNTCWYQIFHKKKDPPKIKTLSNH